MPGMTCIVPLAGPDLYSSEKGFRPLYALPEGPLLRVALRGRPWAQRGGMEGADYVFVVREAGPIEDLIRFLRTGWPGCRIVRLSDGTGGALFSALAGVAYSGNGGALCLDLADILFDADETLGHKWGQRVGGITPCFRSQEACYSYLEEEDGRVTRAAEKIVISDKASAGVYFFRDSAIFLGAAAHSIANASTLAYNGVLFVCPAMNGVLAQGLEVESPMVWNERPVGKLFHQVNDT